MTRHLRRVDKQVLIALLMLSPKENGSGVEFEEIYDGVVPASAGSKSTIYATLREFQRRGWVSVDELWTKWSPPTRSWEYRLLARGRRVIEKLIKDEWHTALEAKQMGYRPQPVAEEDTQR